MSIKNFSIKILIIFFTFQNFLFSIHIISRQDWGANESRRYADNPKYKYLLEEQKKYIENLKKHREKYQNYLKKQKVNKIRNEYLIKFWPNEFRIDKIIKYQNGHKLRRPLQYHYKKTKIVIHHTTNDLTKLKTADDVKKLLRGIYRRHAFTRGWGDIGYNYVIGPFGNIYEGRAGGDGIIGAHAKRNNPASIGIALIGNFNIQNPTKKQLNALIDLLVYLCKKYNINPLQDIIWHKPIPSSRKSAKPPYIKDIYLPTIVGHRDIGYTQCPGKNLYQLLPWIRQQVWKKLNKIQLTTSNTITKKEKNIINLNINKTIFVPSNGQIKIKINKIKNIKNCFSKTDKFDIISCKTKNGYLYLTFERKKFLASGKKTIQIENDQKIYNIKLNLIFQKDLDYLLNKLKKNYILKYHPLLAKYKIKKINHKINLQEAKKLLNGNISVLLYELSTNFKTYKIKCEPLCFAKVDGYITIKNIKNLTILKNLNNLQISINNGKFFEANKITLFGNIIIFTNYNRKSFAGIPWNYFKNQIIIEKQPIKLLNGQIKKQYVVINKLSVKNYLKGIAEVNDQMPQEKNKAMALIIKDYTIFYLKNHHPNIPKGADYQAIDDARIFQKYVGAGFEKTSRKWQKALRDTKNEIILYNGYIPILPYFNCSPGFTFSAKEKFGRIDTPYLKSKLDFYKCKKFQGHGVGLSGKGAEVLAKKGLNYKQILKRYYEGIQIVKIN